LYAPSFTYQAKGENLMRIAVLTGLLACALVFALNSEKTSAITLDQLDNINESTSIDTLLAVAEPKIISNLIAVTVEKEPTELTHTVLEDESLTDIANIHNISWKKIYDKNPDIINPDVINPGEVLVVPSADEVVKARELPVVVAPVVIEKPATNHTASVAAKVTSQVSRGSSPGNLYTAGNCTWYAKRMRPDMPNNLGNARTWVSRAASQGMATGSTPRVGAIAQRYNHVVYVTGINSDGTINISDMNYRSLYAVTYRTVPANQWTYIY
jgi:surface antigen